MMPCDSHRPSPLTPALSRGERENCRPLVLPLPGRMYGQRGTIPPLPAGEGRGEGQGRRATLKLSCTASLLAVLTLFPACSGSKADQDKKKGGPAVPVTVAIATQKDVPVQIQAIGTVRAFATVSVKTRVDGHLAKVGFKEGDPVKKGDLIFTIDPRPFQAELSKAEAMLVRDRASLQNAESGMRRTDELAGTKAVAASLVDENRAKVAEFKATIAADEAAVESAKLQLSYCFIHAPIDGRIGRQLVDEGNVVKNNETILAVINQLEPIYVEFGVPESSLQVVREEAAKQTLRVEAAIPQHEEQVAAGQLSMINNEVDSSTGTILLRAQFQNENEMLWPGQFVNVTLTLRTLKDAVVVPTQAIQLSQQGQYVYVVKSDLTVESRPIVTGVGSGSDVVITKGVAARERVVTSGHLRLVPGAKVEVKAEKENETKKS